MRKNIFFGDSYYTIFAKTTYLKIISRKWITYSDIMNEVQHVKPMANESYCISKCDNYGELKKAFRDVRKLISEKIGKECLEEKGNKRNKSFMYIGEDNDPLSEMLNAKVIDDLKQYWQFCQNSAGFLPESWLEYFFRDSYDLLNIKKRKKNGQLALSASCDRNLKNIELLPLLYESIIGKQVLLFEYKPYNEEVRKLVFHPQYLKEYNGRWHLFGHAVDYEPYYGYNIALDRIESYPIEVKDAIYIPAPLGFYEDFFKDIIGVTYRPNSKTENIRIRVHTYYIYKLLETKMLHTSQKITIPFSSHEDGEYGEITLKIKTNNEFYGRVLQLGAGLEIISPKEVRDILKQKIYSLNSLYDE